MPNPTASLYIYMNGEFVATVKHTPSKDLTLQYEPTWFASENCRPISISLPLSRRAITGAAVSNFFDNLLPDSKNVRRVLKRELSADSTNSLDLLYHLGRDCIGAIQLLAEHPPPRANPLEREPLSNKAIAQLLRDLPEHPLGVSKTNKFRISIAGMQDKTALLQIDGKWYEPIGSTPTTHILKLALPPRDDASTEYSMENEWLCAQITAAFGLPVAKTELAQFEDMQALVVERFDRRWSGDKQQLFRLPQEDMCQALGYAPDDKYEDEGGPGIRKIMDFLKGSVTANQDRIYFLKAQLIFFLLAAIDGHGKNFSIFIEKQGRYSMTPLYDIMSGHTFINPKFSAQKLEMAMALEGKNRHYRWDKIYYRHFLSTAVACGVSAELAGNAYAEVLDNFDRVIRDVEALLPKKFPAITAQTIFGGMLKARDRLKLAGPN